MPVFSPSFLLRNLDKQNNWEEKKKPRPSLKQHTLSEQVAPSCGKTGPHMPTVGLALHPTHSFPLN